MNLDDIINSMTPEAVSYTHLFCITVVQYLGGNNATKNDSI